MNDKEQEAMGRGNGGAGSKSWVQFEEEEGVEAQKDGKPMQSPPNTPAVIDAHAVQVDYNFINMLQIHGNKHFDSTPISILCFVDSIKLIRSLYFTYDLCM